MWLPVFWQSFPQIEITVLNQDVTGVLPQAPPFPTATERGHKSFSTSPSYAVCNCGDVICELPSYFISNRDDCQPPTQAFLVLLRGNMMKCAEICDSQTQFLGTQWIFTWKKTAWTFWRNRSALPDSVLSASDRNKVRRGFRPVVMNENGRSAKRRAEEMHDIAWPVFGKCGRATSLIFDCRK